MGKCKNHPYNETSHFCQKHGYYLCEECLTCGDPKLYCKNRQACLISYRDKIKDDENLTQQRNEESNYE